MSGVYRSVRQKVDNFPVHSRPFSLDCQFYLDSPVPHDARPRDTLPRPCLNSIRIPDHSPPPPTACASSGDSTQPLQQGRPSEPRRPAVKHATEILRVARLIEQRLDLPLDCERLARTRDAPSKLILDAHERADLAFVPQERVCVEAAASGGWGRVEQIFANFSYF